MNCFTGQLGGFSLKKKSNKTNSPFRYPGGKFYARKLILECIPSHKKYCEIFTGGGSVFFAKPSVDISILNDKDEELMNCYRHIRDKTEALIKKLDGIPASKELHSYYKNEYNPKSDLDRAFRWYYLNRTSYSGIMKSVNCYWGYGDKYSMRPENWPGHLRTVSQKLRDAELWSYDFEEAISKLDKNFFLFIDPPYFNADQDKFYTCSFTKDDHYRLAKVLEKHKNKFKFMITYDNCDEIRELYSWCNTLLDKEWNYTMNRTDDQKRGLKLKDGFKNSRYKGKEVFITNYSTEDIKSVPLLKYDSNGRPLEHHLTI